MKDACKAILAVNVKTADALPFACARWGSMRRARKSQQLYVSIHF